METAVVKTETNPIKAYFGRDDIKNKFQELLGNRATGFMTSLLSLIHNSKHLKNANPETIYTSAMMAAMLNLPINPSLGFAYIIPYGDQAQFQIGYKGLIQLALRSGVFKTISSTPVYEGQLVEQNPLTGFIFDWKNKTSYKVIGYAAYFSLLNGFEKTLFMTLEQVEAHGKKFSKTFNMAQGVWKKDFDAMAVKTVLKLLISKYAPLSVEMEKAIIVDQGIIKNADTLEIEYVDEGNAAIAIEELYALYNEKESKLTTAEVTNAKRILVNKEENSYLKLKTLLESK